VGNPGTNGNAAAAALILPVFICPSDDTNPNDRQLSGVHYGPAPGFYGTATNYDFATSATDFSVCNFWKAAGVDQRMFGENSETKTGSVLDGLSNTFALGETTKWHVNGSAFAWAYRTWVMTGVDPAHPTDGGINRWHLPTVHPTWQSPPYVPLRGRIRTWWSPAGSLHPGGCHFAMGDGSVRFFRESTSLLVLTRLARMKDGQVVTIE
jgi:prepilin-type processing-associated H-X9-DG protein